MAITVDNSEIQEAIKLFDIPNNDWYLWFNHDVIYIVWCICSRKLQDYADSECVDVDIKGRWVPMEVVMENQALPTYVCVRYIVAA